MAAGVDGYARRREERLRAALEGEGCRLHVHDTVITALAPGAVTPSTSDHFAVFTPYFRRWSQEPLRDPAAAPRAIRVPDGVGSEAIPSRTGLSGLSEGLARGGESEGAGSGSRPGCARTSPRTSTATTTCRATPPPGSPPICTSAPSPRSNSSTGRARRAARGARRSYGNWPGVTSITRCSPRAPTRPSPTTAPNATVGGRKERRTRTSRRGRRDAPAIQSSTRRTASRGLDAQPGTAAGRQLPHQDAVRGLRIQPGTSWTCWWTAMSPTTSSTGSGWPERARTRVRAASSSGDAGQAVRPGRGATSCAGVPELAVGLAGGAVHEPWKLRGQERAAYSMTPSSNSPTGWPGSGPLGNVAERHHGGAAERHRGIAADETVVSGSRRCTWRHGFYFPGQFIRPAQPYW